MAIFQGYDGNFKIADEAVAETSDWTITINNETFDRKVFGSSGWTETTVVGQSWTGTANGYLDFDDQSTYNRISVSITYR